MICYSKTDAEKRDVILVAVNLHHEQTQTGWVNLELTVLGVAIDQPFEVHDLLTDQHYTWKGARNYIQLDAGKAHIFHIKPA